MEEAADLAGKAPRATAPPRAEIRTLVGGNPVEQRRPRPYGQCMDLRFFDDPADFLDVAGDHLAEQPVLSTVMAGVAGRIRDQRDAGIPWPEGVPCWFVAVLDGDEVVGTAMRTAT